MKVRAHVFLTGMVQGVFFRMNTRTHAKLKNVAGWIKNLPDGRVESMMEGEKDDVEALIEYLKEGPGGASVEDVDIIWEKPSHKYKEFEIKVN